VAVTILKPSTEKNPTLETLSVERREQLESHSIHLASEPARQPSEAKIPS